MTASTLLLPCTSAVIDGELIACDTYSKPDFALLKGSKEVCCWCFDLMELDGRSLRLPPANDGRPNDDVRILSSRTFVIGREA